MASTQKFDELNNLFSEYYEIMDISKEQKLERIELAEELFDVFLFLFTYIDAQISASVSIEIDKDNLYETFARRYIEACENYGIDLDKHPEIEPYIMTISRDMVDSSFDDKNSSKNKNNNVPVESENSASNNLSKVEKTSEKANAKIEERAVLVAENESNTLFNRIEFDDAVNSGRYATKTWITERDDRVRPTHRDVDMKTIPIDKAFIVGESEMMFPKDTSLGADPQEIINCRCSIKYNPLKSSGEEDV